MTPDADPIVTAVAEALCVEDDPPCLDHTEAAHRAVEAHRGAVLDQRDDGEKWAEIRVWADAFRGTPAEDSWKFIFAALADAETARQQAEADVLRLREQNKRSSDEWTRRTAAMESQIARTKVLFEQARRYLEEHSDKPWWQESLIGKYAAVLMMERAEQAEAERDALAGQVERVQAKGADLLDGELAHRSRDYGRGVAQATRAMLAALDAVEAPGR